MSPKAPAPDTAGLAGALAAAYDAELSDVKAALAAFEGALAKASDRGQARRAEILEQARTAPPARPNGDGPVRYLGVTGLAKELGVDPHTMSGWLVRYDNWPKPDAEIHPGRQGPDRGWLPSRVAEWREWMEFGRPGRGAPGRARPSRKAEVVR